MAGEGHLYGGDGFPSSDLLMSSVSRCEGRGVYDGTPIGMLQWYREEETLT